jgi:hypothetical protein
MAIWSHGLRNIEHSDDRAHTETEHPLEERSKYDPKMSRATLDREAPQGRNWATLLILLSIVLVQLFAIGLVIWAIFW